MDLKLTGKTALITGASRGIGQATAALLASEGANVVCVSRSASTTKSDSNISFIHCDLSSLEAVQRLIECLHSKSVKPDIIVNNIGGNLGFTDPFKTSEAWLEVSNLNLVTSMLINEAFIPGMIKNRWGRICHVSSISALENQGPPAYCASKAALNAYVRSLGRYVAEHNVILTTVMPGAIFTEGGYWDKTSVERPDHVEKYLNERMAIKRFGSLSEVANIIAFMVSDATSFAPGTSFLVDGGQGRVFYSD
jgi:3-oxoacyl-[acyl-carrier protein] reductase